MSGEALVTAAATLVVVIVYYIFKSSISKVEQITSKTNHIEEKSFARLDVRKKQSFIDQIDHYIDIGDYDEALNLCNIYYDYNERDEDFDKRIKYIKKTK